MKYLIKKTATLIITLFIVSLLAFLAFSVITGDPAANRLGTEASEEAIAALREEMGLNRPLLVRYFSWAAGLFRGDLGESYTYSMPVASLLADKLPVTAVLTLLSFALTVVIAIPLGILCGNVRSSAVDSTLVAGNQMLMSIPAFFLGMLVSWIFGLTLKLFVPGRFVSWADSPARCIYYLLFPAISVAVPRIAMTVKLLRSSILSERGKDYARTARSRGARSGRILWVHVLRNAMLPVITFLATSLAEIMTGTIIIEQVFTIPGVGRLLLSGISNRDYPLVQAIIVIMAAWIVLVNFLADILNQTIDPRMRLR